MAVSFDYVPVVEVSSDNFAEVWPFIISAIKKCSFLAVDTEMSGIGDRKQSGALSVEDRYRHLCEIAKSRSVLSLGISCFKQKKHKASNCDPAEKAVRKLTFKVKTFNIIVLCKETFIVEPAALTFLVEHGFDFNKQYAKGVLYTRGIDKVPCNHLEYSVRNLFTRLVLAKKPLVLHNGLLDLMFLYQNFYSELPENLHAFTADLSEMFPAGIFDTKFVSQYFIHEQASFLIYLFRKSQRKNLLHQKHGEWFAGITFPQQEVLSRWIEELYCKAHVDRETVQENVAVCDRYAAHGFCSRGKSCYFSHDIDDVLDREAKIKEIKKRKRKRPRTSAEGNHEVLNKTSAATWSPAENSHAGEARDVHVSQVDYHVSKLDKVKTRDCGHRAGFDAFMTGYSMATYQVELSKQDKELSLSSLAQIANKVSLAKKDVPLQITRSHFTKPSALHSEKLKRARETLSVTENSPL